VRQALLQPKRESLRRHPHSNVRRAQHAHRDAWWRRQGAHSQLQCEYTRSGASALLTPWRADPRGGESAALERGVLRSMFDSANNSPTKVSAPGAGPHSADKRFRTIHNGAISASRRPPSFGKPALFHDRDPRGLRSRTWPSPGRLIRSEEEAFAAQAGRRSIQDAAFAAAGQRCGDECTGTKRIGEETPTMIHRKLPGRG